MAAPAFPEFSSFTLDNRAALPSGVLRGRELTRKQHRLPSGISQFDALLDGGVVCGRISELIGPIGAGKTSLAMAFAAQATQTQAVAWIETGDSLDPASATAAGIRNDRLLWVSCRPAAASGAIAFDEDEKRRRKQGATACLKAAEWILSADGFGLLIIDFGAVHFIPSSAALRLARAAERSGAAILILAQARLCGTFAALSLSLNRRRPCFSQSCAGAPVLFDNQRLEARVLRNKLGGAGATIQWDAAIKDGPATPNQAEGFEYAPPHRNPGKRQRN